MTWDPVEGTTTKTVILHRALVENAGFNHKPGCIFQHAPTGNAAHRVPIDCFTLDHCKGAKRGLRLKILKFVGAAQELMADTPRDRGYSLGEVLAMVAYAADRGRIE
jgi:hypothetical protein